MYSCVLHQWNSYERMCPTCWPSTVTSDSTELIINPTPSTEKDQDELWEEVSDLLDEFSYNDEMSMEDLKNQLKRYYHITKKP